MKINLKRSKENSALEVKVGMCILSYDSKIVYMVIYEPCTYCLLDLSSGVVVRNDHNIISLLNHIGKGFVIVNLEAQEV